MLGLNQGGARQGREVRVGQGRVRQSRAGLACLRALRASVLALILGSNLASPLLIQLADGHFMRRCGRGLKKDAVDVEGEEGAGGGGRCFHPCPEGRRCGMPLLWPFLGAGDRG